MQAVRVHDPTALITKKKISAVVYAAESVTRKFKYRALCFSWTVSHI